MFKCVFPTMELQKLGGTWFISQFLFNAPYPILRRLAHTCKAFNTVCKTEEIQHLIGERLDDYVDQLLVLAKNNHLQKVYGEWTELMSNVPNHEFRLRHFLCLSDPYASYDTYSIREIHSRVPFILNEFESGNTSSKDVFAQTDKIRAILKKLVSRGLIG